MRNATSMIHARRVRTPGARRRIAIAAAVGGIVATCAPLPGWQAAAGAAACSSSVSAGDQTITVDGADVPLYLPAGYGSRPVPLVLDLHGSSSSGRQAMAGDGIRAVADANGFAVIAPNGAVPFSPAPGFSGWAWNIPGVPLVGTTIYPPAGTRDDIAFLSHAIDAVQDAACIDARRIYATGVSGGGRMASQLACDLSHRIAAIAPISGVRFPMASDTPPHTVDCSPARPVPVIAIHGAWDPVNVFADAPPAEAATLPAAIGTPVAGSSWSYSAETAVDRWARNNGCRTERPRITAVTANIDEIAYRGCHRNADVVLLKLNNSGHMSPGHGSPALDGLLNPTNAEVDGTVVAWEFLSRHRLH
jgi:polyhydroxybutyrate depolymerase